MLLQSVYTLQTFELCFSSFRVNMLRGTASITESLEIAVAFDRRLRDAYLWLCLIEVRISVLGK